MNRLGLGNLLRIHRCHDSMTTLFGNSLAFVVSAPSASVNRMKEKLKWHWLELYQCAHCAQIVDEEQECNSSQIHIFCVLCELCASVVWWTICLPANALVTNVYICKLALRLCDVYSNNGRTLPHVQLQAGISIIKSQMNFTWCNTMKSFKSRHLLWYCERREYMRWIIAVTLPNTTACIKAENSNMNEHENLIENLMRTAIT